MSLSLVHVSQEYCDFLRKFDPIVPLNAEEKENRPFVGVVLNGRNGYSYFVPMTSPKEKHLTLKNTVDFLKIDGGRLGALNFNNMIPVPENCLELIPLKSEETDTEEKASYKNLLRKQKTWCSKNEKAIRKRASKLYALIQHQKAWPSLQNRCCNFILDEQKCNEYEILKGWRTPEHQDIESPEIYLEP